MSKRLALLIIAILAVSSLLMVESAFAQSITKPSVPDFTVKFVDFYDVPPTYEVDAETGDTVITQEGFRIDWCYLIVVTIKNQPFTPYNDTNGNLIGLYYDIDYKFDFDQYWSGSGLSLASDSAYTERLYICGRQAGEPKLRNLKSGDKLYFKVQAYIGTTELSLFDNNFVSEASDWSDTQTLTIGESQTPTPSPATTPTPTTPMPSQEPPQTEQIEPILSAAIVVAVIIAVLGLLIYLTKRK